MSGGVVRCRGLQFTCSEAEFVGFFAPYQPIQVLVTGGVTGEGFAQFDSDETANAVCTEKNRQYLGARYVECFMSSPDEMNSRAPVNATTGEAYCHARGLPFACTAGDLAAFFGQFGTQEPDVSVKIVMQGPNQGKPSGDAVIKFPNMDIRDQAIAELNSKSIGGRYVELFPATQKDWENKGGLGGKKGGVGANSIGGAAGGMKDGDWICPACGDHQFAKNTQCRKCGGPRPADLPVFMAGISGGLKEGDWICPMPNCGDHQFARNQSCRKCGAMKPIGGGMSSNQIGMAPVAGIQMQRENVPPPAVAPGALQVRLRGVPPTCGQVEVSQFLAEFNVAPANVTLTYTSRGTPSGDAYVSFATQWQADEVCSKNGQGIRGSVLEICTVKAQGGIVQAPGKGGMMQGGMMPQYGQMQQFGGKGMQMQRAAPY